MPTNENVYQSRIKRKLKLTFPGCTILKNDTDHFQGIPDLLILYGKKWAALEVKRSQNAKHQPNQDYYIEKFNQNAFASFIYPENEDEVFSSLKEYFDSEV